MKNNDKRYRWIFMWHTPDLEGKWYDVYHHAGQDSIYPNSHNLSIHVIDTFTGEVMCSNLTLQELAYVTIHFLSNTENQTQQTNGDN